MAATQNTGQGDGVPATTPVDAFSPGAGGTSVRVLSKWVMGCLRSLDSRACPARHVGRRLARIGQASPKVFLKPFSTGPAGMKRRSLARSVASPLGVCRIFQSPSAASTIVLATPSGSGAF